MDTHNLRFTYLQSNSSVDMHNLARVTGPSALATRADNAMVFNPKGYMYYVTCFLKNK
jgi:hypothetical protein